VVTGTQAAKVNPIEPKAALFKKSRRESPFIEAMLFLLLGAWKNIRMSDFLGIGAEF
jgi:hypothetical protein